MTPTVAELAATLRALSPDDARELVTLLMDGRVSEVEVDGDMRIVASLIRMRRRRDLAMALAGRWAYYGGRARAALAILTDCDHDVSRARLKEAVREIGEPLLDPELIALDEEINLEYRR